MMRKFFLVFAWFIGSLAILLVLFYAEEDWRGKHAWETHKRQREAKGDSFEWSSVTPVPVPDDQNFAATPLFAKLFPKPPQNARLNEVRLPDCPRTYGNWHIGRVENFVGWQECFANTNRVSLGRPKARDVADTALSDKSFTNIYLSAELKKYDPFLREIAAASRKPHCRFPLQYQDNYDMGLPHLNPLGDLARVYRLRAMLELSAGQTASASEDVQTCLRLADTIKDEPLLISFLVRIAILDNTVQPVWEGLTEHRWSENELAKLEEEFGKIDLFEGYAKSLQGERVQACQWIFSLRKGPYHLPGGWLCCQDELDKMTKEFGLLCQVIPSGWFYQNALTVDRFYQEFLPVVDWQNKGVYPWRCAQVYGAFQAARPTPYNAASKFLVPGIPMTVKKAALSQTSLDEAAVACALERYHLAHGAFPEGLDLLVPQFIDRIPADLINGQPLRYRLSPDGQYVLYSIGWNETDDGGQVAQLGRDYNYATQDVDNGDWVWFSRPQPQPVVNERK